ncbi:hypothetical protein QQ045_023076 [Rhodiola kirilowii]
MSGKLPKASLNHLQGSKSGTLEPRKEIGSCTACCQTSGLDPRNSAERAVNDAGDAGVIGGILDLPVHVIFDIFSRLPLKQVFICRSTCKTFRYLLSRPSYSVLSLDKAQPCLLLREFSRKRFPNFFDREAYVSDLVDETRSTFFYSKAYLVDLEEVKDCTSPANPSVLIKHEIFSLPAGKLELVGSCNGLVCLYQPKTAQYYICNPLLGEWTVLPNPSYESTSNRTSSATYSLFGFCPKSKQYKIVRFISSSVLVCPSSAVEIITVGAVSWRYIGDGPLPRTRGSFSPSPVGDILFTIDIPVGSSSSASTIICSFNLELEQFHMVPSPPHFSPDYITKLSWVNVGRLHSALCICYIHNESTLELWTTDNQSITNPNWTQRSSATFRYWHLLFRMDKHHPAVFLDNNYDMWMKHEGTRNVYKFSHQMDEMRAFKVPGVGTGFEIVAHIPSFVRLKDALITRNAALEVFHYGYKLWPP